MKFDDILYALESVFQFSFSILEWLGNIPNILFLIIGFIAATIWTLQLVKYSKEPNN